MSAKHEITRKFAHAYTGASKRDKGRLLDEACAITGWSRANARRQLTAASGSFRHTVIRTVEGDRGIR